MNLGQMRARVLPRIVFPSGNADLNSAINDAINGRYDLVCVERQWWDWLGKTWSVVAVAGTARIGLAAQGHTDIMGISSVVIEDYGVEVPPCGQQIDRIKRLSTAFRPSGATNGWDAEWDNATAYLLLQPAPSGAYTYTIRGIRIRTPLTADTHAPIFPEPFHQMLVEGAVADLAVGDQYDAQIAALAEQKYQRFLQNMKNFCKLAIPPIRAIPHLHGQFGAGR